MEVIKSSTQNNDQGDQRQNRPFICYAFQCVSSHSDPSGLFRHHNITRFESRFDLSVGIVLQTDLNLAFYLLSILEDSHSGFVLLVLVDCSHGDKQHTSSFASDYVHSCCCSCW